MKKLTLLFLVLVLKFAPSKAQWVTIPDPNFVTKLQQLFPSCMNGNQMDTTCAGIVNATRISLLGLNISDLTGMQYFDNLNYFRFITPPLTFLPPLTNTMDTLIFSNTLLNNLPQWPNSLLYLECYSNQLTNLPAFPNSLKYIDCHDNQLTSLPTLPSFLINLNCNENQLLSLPTLPNTLQNLYCNENQITNMPNFPNSLNYLVCNNNQLTSLPPLNNISSLSCSFNQLTSLPPLNSINNLNCSNNLFTSLPQLPTNMNTLYCNNNQLTSLPTLPIFENSPTSGLDCSNNLLTSLPDLNNYMKFLYCDNNLLTSLPALPNYLWNLTCSNNQLTTLPTLQSNLATLVCNNNQLSSLPTLPNNLSTLNCSYNQLSSLPPIPTVLSKFLINNNNISCLSSLPYISSSPMSFNVNISNNPLTCVPNLSNFNSGGLPLCFDNDPINNPNNCPSVNITGYVYTDLNNNCSYNNNDWRTQNIPVKLFDNQNNLLQTSYTINGIYSFNTLLPDTYHVKIDVNTLPISMDCGQLNTQNINLGSTNQTISNINFPVVCDSIYDINVQSVNSQGWVFPGEIHRLYTDITSNISWFNLNCDTTLYSGTVTIEVTGPLTYVSSTNNALIPQVNGNTFTYNITDFNSLSFTSFGLKFLTNTTAQANDQICVHVEISPNPIDADTTNNVYDFCYNVVNSYDPNIKQVYPQNVLPGYDDWFTYTIYFQNTGNAPAFNIRLRDTLDTQLDLNTFEMLGYSHPATTTLSGNILTVRFNNIMLPDSTSNPEGSIGYYQYRIKPMPNLPNGSQIRNTCYIYFDFNAPIITNTTENNFEITVSATNFKSNPETYEIYPNPSNGIFMLSDSKNIQSVEIFSLLGELLYTQQNGKSLNLHAYPKGVYMARINGQVMKKLVKE